MIAVYPGSFDPVTYGHLDIIERAARMFDEVVVLLMVNDAKPGTFTMQERKEMIESTITHLKNVRVEIGSGLTVEYAYNLGARVIIRGIRAVTDYEYEMQMGTANLALNPQVETIFMMAKPEYSFLSSSIAKSIAINDGDLDYFVPPFVARRMKEELIKK